MRRPSPAAVVALISLFVSLTGSATAAKLLVTSREIKNGTIQLVDISKKAQTALRSRGAAASASASASADPSPDVRLRSETFTTLLSASVTMPARGRLMAVASLGLVNGAALPATALCRLFVEDAAILSQQAARSARETGERLSVSVAGARVLPAGTYNVLARCGADGDASAVSFDRGDLLVWTAGAPIGPVG